MELNYFSDSNRKSKQCKLMRCKFLTNNWKDRNSINLKRIKGIITLETTLKVPM